MKLSRSKYTPLTNTPLLKEAREESHAGEPEARESKENEVSEAQVAMKRVLLIADRNRLY